MLDRIVTFCLSQRVFVLVLVAALVAFGVRAALNLRIEAFPDVQDVQVQVIAQYPGQAPEEMERLVALPIEREMAGVPRLVQLRSVSITGLAVVTLTFAEGTDDYFARQQVLEKLQIVNLPPGVQPQLAPLSNALGEVYRYAIEAPPGMPAYEVRAIQDWVVRPYLRMVPGVADVISFGGTLKEYQVKLNPFQLKKHAVTIDQVAQAIGNASSNAGGGLLRRGEEALVVRGIGLFRSIEDIKRVAVASRQGRPILVADVATAIEVGPRPRSGIVGFNDRDDVVEGVVQMIKGQNAKFVVEALHERLDGLKARLPPGVKLVPIYQRTDLINHTVWTVTENLALGAALVIAILVLFLRNWRAALIVASVIPLSLLVAFIMIDARGLAANLISLGAVDFGIIVDSAVVLVEALMVRLAAGAADANPAHRTYGWRLTTLKHTVVELGHPILFSKAIIILAFLPIFTFQRVEGKIFSPVAYTLSFALLGAVILTVTFVPTLLSYAVRGDMAERESRWMHALQDRYRRLLVWAEAHVQAVVAGSVATLAVALAALPLLGSEFLPKLDEGNIWLTLTLPPASSLESTKQVERGIREILRGYPEVRSLVTQVGRPDDGTDPKGANNLEILAELAPRGTWRFPTKEALVTDMAGKVRTLPGVATNFSQVIQDNVEEALSGAKGEIVVKVVGPDLDILEDKADQIVSILKSVRGATDVAAFRVGGQSEVRINLDRAKLARYGIAMNDANAVIQTALAGNAVSAFYEGDRRYDVTLRVDAPFRDAVDDIANLQVSLPADPGANLPPGVAPSVSLGEIATVEIRQGAARISREAGSRFVAVKVNLIGRDQGSFVAEAMARVKGEIRMPPGYVVTWGGQFENQQRALARLRIIVPISLLAIFTLLLWAFGSIYKALLVLAMVPFTLIGGIAALAAAGLHLSISAAVGFIAVAGISVQNGVIMVEHIVERMRMGAALGAAVTEGAVARLRPILMTALMAGLGLLPAALSHGIGSETQRPFAVVIVGGIVSATVFTLLLLPLAYSRFVRDPEAA
jgi:cobalt-zinc-cadmium resistance protein CzcA